MEAFDIIRAIMKEFSQVSDDDIKLFISISEPLISKKRFGKVYPQALAYMAAHKMKLAGNGSAVANGTIGDTIGLASVSEGETSVTFTNNQMGNSNSDAEYSLTIYGMQYLQLRRSCIIPIVSAGVGNGR